MLCIRGTESHFASEFISCNKRIYRKYIHRQNTSKPITLPQNILAEVKAKARKKIRYNMNEKKFGMSDVMKIYNKLI